MNHHDIQATQEIIQLFERSKTQSEDSLDSLPGIYAIVDGEGTILKGNRRLAAVFGVGHELVLHRQLSQLFAPDNWLQFKNRVNEVKALESGHEAVEFQLDMTGPDSKIRNYTWSLRSIRTTRSDILLTVVLGQDVTELKSLTSETTRMQMEFNTAKAIQSMLFPPPTSRFGRSEIAGHYESASECGGDWWYYSQTGRKLYLWIGDVTGHGVPAALITSAARSAVSLIEMENLSASAALNHLNRAIYETSKGQMMMTFVVAVVDLDSGLCTFSQASHLPIVLIPGGKKLLQIGDLVSLVLPPSLPLGMGGELIAKEGTAQLTPGDRLFFCTDGLFDIINPDGDPLKAVAFRRILATSASEHRGTMDLVDSIKSRVAEFRGGTSLVDDVTYFVFKL